MNSLTVESGCLRASCKLFSYPGRGVGHTLLNDRQGGPKLDTCNSVMRRMPPNWTHVDQQCAGSSKIGHT
jgi:hypothetical protein